jgi:dihydroxyacetone kinase-like predicted kinase
MAANQVSALTDKKIHVIPSRSVPQGLAALASFNRDSSLDDNVRKMTNALGEVQSIEITQAVRDVELNGVIVVTGDLIGMVNDELVASGSDLGDIVTRTLIKLEDVDPELLTVFVGEDATDAATDALRDTATAIFPEAEIEIIEGNQPHYQYLIAVE